MTINGQPANMIKAAPYLAPFELRPGILRSVVRHRCDGQCDETPRNDLPGGTWSHCPRYVLRSPWWRSVVALWQQLRLSGSLDLDNRAAWVVFGLITLKAQAEKEAARHGNRKQ